MSSTTPQQICSRICDLGWLSCPQWGSTLPKFERQKKLKIFRIPYVLSGFCLVVLPMVFDISCKMFIMSSTTSHQICYRICDLGWLNCPQLGSTLPIFERQKNLKILRIPYVLSGFCLVARPMDFDMRCMDDHHVVYNTTPNLL